MRPIYFIFTLFAFIHFVYEVSPQDNIIPVSLTIERCLELALRQNPQLEPYQWELRAQDGDIEQAGLRPNPEFDVEVENFLGSNGFRWFDGSETTFSLTQTIETGRKRAHRTRVAETEKKREARNYELTRQHVFYETSVAYTELLAAQERIAVFAESLQVSERILQTIKAMVDAGRDSPIEMTRAELMVASVRIEWERSLSERERAKIILARQWGGSGATIEDVTGDLFAIHPESDLNGLLAEVDLHPLLRVARSEITLRQAQLGLESSKSVPDIQIGAGVRYLADSDDGALVASFSIPLPLRDRNQGAIRAASNRLNQAEAQRSALVNELRSELEAAYQEVQQTRDIFIHLKSEILPRTDASFQAIQEGYQQGKFPYLNVLDAQRTSFETQSQTVEAALAYQQAWHRMNRLTGQFAIDLPPIKE